MATIYNQTGVPHFWFEKSGINGEPLDIFILCATFDLASHGKPMTLAPVQNPVTMGDSFAGPIETDPLRAVIEQDGDLVPYKPGTDILAFGHAQAPQGHPSEVWLARLCVGPVDKVLKLSGPRDLKKKLMHWRLGPSQAVSQVALDYRLAFGGCIDIPGHLMADGQADTVRHLGNPAGCGWLPKSVDLKHLPKAARKYVENWVAAQDSLRAPQIESVEQAIQYPAQSGATQGFSAIARWCSPRIGYQGHYDDEWQRIRYPLPPLDFESRYYQAAPPDQIAIPHLRGDEAVTLIGLLPERADMQLPSWSIIAAVKYASGEHAVSLPLLDTVRFDLNRRQATLVWRTHFRRADPVVEISVASAPTSVAIAARRNMATQVQA